VDDVLVEGSASVQQLITDNVNKGSGVLLFGHGQRHELQGRTKGGAAMLHGSRSVGEICRNQVFQVQLQHA